jgi:hypothetical protein
MTVVSQSTRRVRLNAHRTNSSPSCTRTVVDAIASSFRHPTRPTVKLSSWCPETGLEPESKRCFRIGIGSVLWLPACFGHSRIGAVESSRTSDDVQETDANAVEPVNEVAKSVAINSEAVQPERRLKGRSDGQSALDKLFCHWPEYLMEGAEVALYMFSACAFATLIQHPASPVRRFFGNAIIRDGYRTAPAQNF